MRLYRSDRTCILTFQLIIVTFFSVSAFILCSFHLEIHKVSQTTYRVDRNQTHGFLLPQLRGTVHLRKQIVRLCL